MATQSDIRANSFAKTQPFQRGLVEQKPVTRYAMRVEEPFSAINCKRSDPKPRLKSIPSCHRQEPCPSLAAQLGRTGAEGKPTNLKNTTTKHKNKTHTNTHKKYNQHKTISTNNCCCLEAAFLLKACSFLSLSSVVALCFLSFRRRALFFQTASFHPLSLSVVSRRVTLPPPSGRRRARSSGGGGGGCERTLVPHEKHNENPQLKTKQHVPRRRLAPGGGSRRCCFCAARVCVLFSVLQAVRSFEGPNHEIAVRRALKPKQRKRHTTTTCFNQQTQPATPKKPTVTPKPTQLRSG